MKTICYAVLAGMLCLSGVATAAPFSSGSDNAQVIQIQDMELAVPPGWTLEQDAEDQGTIILGFANGDDYLTFFVKREFDLDMHAMFANSANIIRDVFDYPRTSFNWKAMQTSKASRRSTAYVASFKTDYDGFTYYGYSRSANSSRSMEIINSFLSSIR